MILINYLKLIRANQWVKNLIIFLPLFFSGELTNQTKFIETSLSFLVFCLLSSVVYIFNDIIDLEYDKLHPSKSKRPIAAGLISINHAFSIAAILFSLSFLCIITFYGIGLIFILMTVYISQNILYTLKLKHFAIIDVTIISIGFVLRIIVGGLAANVYLSSWIILLSFLLSLFLALAKRRDDLQIKDTTTQKMRKAIDGYSYQFIDISLAITAAIVIVSYIMYYISDWATARLGQYTYLTSLFVIISIFRYLQITLVVEKSGNPTKILYSDKFMQLIILMWIASFIILLYFN